MATQGNEDASGPNKRYRRNSQNSAETHNTAFSNATSGGNVGWAALNSSRDIADLFPAERLIVWAFRHLSQGAAGTNIVEKQLSCLMLEPEADAFLTAGLAINAQFQLPPAGDAPQRSISIAEERLLAFFFAAQVGSSLHTVLGEPLFKSNSLLIVWRDAKDICDLLSAATLAFSSPPDLEPPCWRMGKLLPAVNLAPRLSSGERLILRALRCCSAQKDSGESLDSEIHGIFNRHGVSPEGAEAAIELFLHLNRMGAPIHSLCSQDCPHIQDVERHVLALVACAGGEHTLTRCSHLPPVSDRRTHTAANRLLQALYAARLAMPRRRNSTQLWAGLSNSTHPHQGMTEKNRKG